MKPLRFGATIIEAYRFVWDNRRDFFAFAYLPVLASAIFSTIVDAVYPIELPRDLSQISPEQLTDIYLRALLTLAFGLMMFVLFAVPWHRLQLLGGGGSTVGAQLRWQPRHWRYLGRLFLLLAGYAALLALIFRLITATGAGGGGGVTISPVAGLIGVFLQILLFAQLLRFGVLLTAVAVEDAGVTSKVAWRMTRRCAPILLGLFFAAVLPILFGGLIVLNQVAALVGPELLIGSLPLRFAFTLLGEAVSFAAIAVLTSAFSIAYRELKAQGAVPV
jgi:hypothetical protein